MSKHSRQEVEAKYRQLWGLLTSRRGTTLAEIMEVFGVDRVAASQMISDLAFNRNTRIQTRGGCYYINPSHQRRPQYYSVYDPKGPIG